MSVVALDKLAKDPRTELEVCLVAVREAPTQNGRVASVAFVARYERTYPSAASSCRFA